jgi:hypothetical protein
VSCAAPWRMIAGGDDVLIQGIEDLKFCEVLVGLGFTPKPRTCLPGLGVFYSGFFLPTDQGLVLTPFIGRTFEKLGMSSRPVEDGWQYGVLLGLLAVYNHVPGVVKILRHLMTRYPCSIRSFTPKQNYLTPKQYPAHKPIDTDHALEIFYPDYENHIAVLYSEYECARTAFVSVALDGFLSRE